MQTRQLTTATWLASCSLFGSLAVLLSSSIFSPALAKSQKQQASPLKTPARYKVLECPEKFSIGRLYVLSNLDLTAQVIDTATATVRKHAQGRLSIPQKGYTFLLGNYALGENLQPLQKLKGDDLQVLRLSKLTFNQSDLQYLTGLTGLQRIELDSTDVGDEGLKVLAKLPNLVFISITRTLVTGKTLADLGSMKKLTVLQIGHNALCDGNLKGLTALKSLKSLRLQACQLRDKDLEPIGQLKALESLALHENKSLTDNGIKYLAKMPSLNYLDVCQTSITASGIKSLKNCPLTAIHVEVGQLKKEEIAQLQAIFPKANIAEENSERRLDPVLFKPLH
jgi:hypothetical protein